MTRTIAALLAAATVAGVAAPAAAQTKYFARERIAGIATRANQEEPTAPPTTYVPTYSKTYGACVGGSQTAPIASCATSQGSDVALSACSGSPQTVSKTCLPIACTTYHNAQPGGGGAVKYGTDTTEAAAMARCKTLADSYGRGVCQWNGTGSSYVGVYQTFDANGVYYLTGPWGVGGSTGWPYNLVTAQCK